MRICYVIGQGLRMLRSNKMQTFMLILCYAGGILLPMIMFSYRQGLTENFTYEDPVYHLYSSFTQNVTKEQFAKLTDYNAWNTALRDAGDGFQASVASFGLSTAFTVGGNVLKGTVVWRLPADEAGLICSSFSESVRVIGENLSPDRPYELLLGDGLLHGLDNPERLIGEQITLFGERYTVAGIMQGSDNFEVNMLSRSTSKLLSLRFRIPRDTPHSYSNLVQVMNEQLGITGIAEQKITESYAEATMKSSNWMLAVAVAGFVFCLLNSLGIVNSVLYDCRAKVYTKLTMGARRKEVFLELMVFWGVLLASSCVLAFIAMFGARAYMEAFFFHSPSTDWTLLALLPLLGLGTAAVISLHSVRRIGGWLK